MEGGLSEQSYLRSLHPDDNLKKPKKRGRVKEYDEEKDNENEEELELTLIN